MSLPEASRQVERIVGTGSAAFDQVRSRVESLARLREPSLVVPSRVAMVRADEVVVAEPQGDHDTLRALVDARGPLRAGECVWWGTAVAQALAALHRHGLTHGALDADAVIVADGRVALTRLVDAPPDAGPADDIEALGSLLASVVRAADADRMRAWTEPMTHTDPAGRPTASMVARALSSCAPPEAVVAQPLGVAAALRDAAAAGGKSARRPRAVMLDEARWWRARLRAEVWVKKMAMVAVGASLVTGAVFAGAWLLRDGHDAVDAVDAAVGPSTAVYETAPVEAARELTLARFKALSGSDGAALVALTVEGSPARADAQEMADALGSKTLRIDGLAGVVQSADLIGEGHADDDLAPTVIRVRYRLGPHTVVLDGDAVEYGAYTQTVDLTLAWDHASGWLVQDAQVADASGSSEDAANVSGAANLDAQ